ncbi:MAG: signal recognition particle-docking protein FtsY, partial [Aeromicrobium sp.]
MTTTVLVLIIAAAVVLVGGGVAFLVTRGGDGTLPPPDVLDEITTEVIKHPEHPEPHLASDDEEVPFEEIPADERGGAPAIERPEASQGRLVRLRGRLARSNSSLGKG